MLYRFSGVTVRRVVDRSRSRVPEHAHDWPVLSLFVIGGYSNRTEIGDAFIAGPSAILYRAGAAHQNTAANDGFEQVEIEFDPAWLHAALPDGPVSQWLGGHSSMDARALAQFCSRSDVSEVALRARLQRFFQRADMERARQPSWLDSVTQRLRNSPAMPVTDLARAVGHHPAWLGVAYRRATGEGLLAAAARFRTERAARLLRETEEPIAVIAAGAGFCDQSHMNRTFRRILARTPLSVRDDRHHFRQGAMAA